MSERPGAFIVIEGTDGSGKGTQFELLTARLREAGYQVATFDFPQYEKPSSYFVQQYLNGKYGSAEEVGPYTGSLFYALDRYESAPAIREALARGQVVVCNRFAGSNMAHQGAKFRNAEERRGFFIWLDNLEFEMLHIPRPDISFVLRVPAGTAQALVDQKTERTYTSKKRDLHEADLKHLELAVEVYDDLAQLFPKDFQRIDCVRGGKLLDIEAVQAMLWEKVSPLLPRPGQLEMPMTTARTTARDKETSQPTPEEDGHSARDEIAPAITLEAASSLLIQKLQLSGLRITAKPRGTNHYYTPLNFAPELRQQYQAGMDRLLAMQVSIQQKLTAYLATLPPGQAAAAQAEAVAAGQLVLPAAAITGVYLAGADNNIKDLITTLLADELPESRAAGKVVLAQTKLDNLPAIDVVQQAATALQKLAQAQLPETHTARQQPIRLLHATPRNELYLAADMLYPYSGEALGTLRDLATRWPYNRKLDIFETYLGSQAAGRALENATYQWDLLTSFSAMSELLATQAMPHVSWQTLTPRYGFDMPALIEQAGLGEKFEACFDLSLTLYSLLQQVGHHAEAQYATLQGHKLRWHLTHTAQGAFRLQKILNISEKTELRTFAAQLWKAVAEVHPIIGESLQAAGANARSTPSLRTTT
jgi:dTMP kinase